MYRIMNDSKRSFIVDSKEVIKGGLKGHKENEKIIPGGKSIVEVSDRLGKSLTSYAGVLVVEIVKEGKGK